MTVSYTSCPVCDNREIAFKLTATDFTVSHEQFEIWECSSCTLRFTQNIPDGEHIGKYYISEEYISHSDTKKGLINSLYHKVRKRTLNLKRKLITTNTGIPSGNILDIGAGTGAFLHTMKQAGWNATGIEPDETARGKAKELYGIEFRENEQLFALPDNSFDAITMWHVLEHVHDLQAYVKKLRELLKPDGHIFIAVPNYTCYDEEAYKEYWAAYDVPRHLYHFSPRSMKALIKRNALTLKKVAPMWFDSFYVSLLSEKYKNGKTNYASAFINGCLSNLKALMNKERCSSVIYIIKK